MEHETLNSEHTKHKILKAAVELFAKHGFNGVSTRKIAKSASCNIASLNYHFGTKKKLYQECIAVMEPKAKYDFDNILVSPNTKADFEKAFRSYCIAVAEFIIENASTIKLLINEINSEDGFVENSFLTPLRNRFETFLEESKVKGLVNPKIEVKLISNMVISSIICQKLFKSFQTYETISDAELADKIVTNMTSNIYLS